MHTRERAGDALLWTMLVKSIRTVAALKDINFVHVQNFFLGGGVASRVPSRWRDSYGKTENFGRVGDKNMFKMYKKGG